MYGKESGLPGPEPQDTLVARKGRKDASMPKLVFAPGSPAEPQLVYGHRFLGEDEIFYIGSGTYSRARSTRRGQAWQSHVGDRAVEIVILEVHSCPARARLREAELIAEQKPLTNEHHKAGPHPQVLRGYTKQGHRCDCSAPDCYGREAMQKERA